MYPVPEHGKGILHASVWDVTHPPVSDPNPSADPDSTPTSTSEGEPKPTSSLPDGIAPGTVDVAVMIFVMSALHPMEWQRAIANAYKVSKDVHRIGLLEDHG
jgi:tRNAThr (cytosine32-N3)-methyltransferase